MTPSLESDREDKSTRWVYLVFMAVSGVRLIGGRTDLLLGDWLIAMTIAGALGGCVKHRYVLATIQGTMFGMTLSAVIGEISMGRPVIGCLLLLVAAVVVVRIWRDAPQSPART